MPHDARAIANYVLDCADENETEITHLALQKVLYFSHGWWLSKEGQPLIAQSFEAWDHGPVLRIVYESFRQGPKGLPIRSRATRLNLFTREQELATSNLKNSEAVFLSGMVEYYGKIRPFDLVSLTHEKGTPWDLVWNAHVFSPGDIIDNIFIKKYFDRISARLGKH